MTLINHQPYLGTYCIYLGNLFPEGTIGHELEEVRVSHTKPLFVIEREASLKQTVLDHQSQMPAQHSKPIDIGEIEQEPNPDEVLRQSGFYDTTDKRCCVNRKKT